MIACNQIDQPINDGSAPAAAPHIGRFYVLVAVLGAHRAGRPRHPGCIRCTNGFGVTGIRWPVFWAFYVTNFVFWIGISHAGTLISAILRLVNASGAARSRGALKRSRSSR